MKRYTFNGLSYLQFDAQELIKPDVCVAYELSALAQPAILGLVAPYGAIPENYLASRIEFTATHRDRGIVLGWYKAAEARVSPNGQHVQVISHSARFARNRELVYECRGLEDLIIFGASPTHPLGHLRSVLGAHIPSLRL